MWFLKSIPLKVLGFAESWQVGFPILTVLGFRDGVQAIRPSVGSKIQAASGDLDKI